MTTEELRSLHDKRTRGQSLSVEEQASLDAWYVRQDQEEAAALNRAPEQSSIERLQAQVQAANADLLAVTQRIHAATAENARLRDEITALQERVKRRANAQPV